MKQIKADGTQVVLFGEGRRGEVPLTQMQAAVGGWIEQVPDSLMVVNEEGRLLDLPMNLIASVMVERQILGDVLVFADEAELSAALNGLPCPLMRPNHPAASPWWCARAPLDASDKTAIFRTTAATFKDGVPVADPTLTSWMESAGFAALEQLVDHEREPGPGPKYAAVEAYTIAMEAQGRYLHVGAWLTPALPPPVPVGPDHPEPLVITSLRQVVSQHQALNLDNFTGKVVPDHLVKLAIKHSRAARGWFPIETEDQEDADLVLRIEARQGQLNPVLVDVTSANAALSIYEGLAWRNRQTFINVTVQGRPVYQRSLATMTGALSIMDMVWRLVTKCRR